MEKILLLGKDENGKFIQHKYRDKTMKEEQKNIDSPMIAQEWFEENKPISSTVNVIKMLDGYADYKSQYHVEKASQLIAERAKLYKTNYSDMHGQHEVVSVDKQSILSTAKEYVELNIKR